MKKTLQIANISMFVLMVFINYLSNTGAINNTSMGEISNSIDSLFTPAGYAFSIWGVIYLLLAGFIVYQSRSLFTTVKDDSFILKTGWWFVISCFANIMWIIFWLYGYFNFSVLAMFVLLYSLLTIVLNNDMELWDAPIPVIAFLWWPFVIYSGWVTVASIANVSAYLVTLNWRGWGMDEITWTVIMILVAGIINIAVTWTINMREFAFVGVWGLVAIAVANWYDHSTIAYSAVVVAAIVFISSAIHGYKNRKENPFFQMLN